MPLLKQVIQSKLALDLYLLRRFCNSGSRKISNSAVVMWYQLYTLDIGDANLNNALSNLKLAIANFKGSLFGILGNHLRVIRENING